MMPTMKAVIYVRVSSADQVDGTSLDTQQRDCVSWCARNGYTVMVVFIERGESAKTADRTELLNLLDFCRREKPDVVVVWKFDRWARAATDHAVTRAALARTGTRLVSATEVTSDDPAGRLLETILSGIAQFDNEVRAQRARAAMTATAMRGGWTWRAPYGYTLARVNGLPSLHPDADKASVVIDLFDGIASGRRTLEQTVAHGRALGIPGNSTRKMLRAPVYAGLLRSSLTDGREVVGAWPGIVSVDVWRRVQSVIVGKPQVRAMVRDEFPLRGILHCAECGRLVTACWIRGNGGRYGYYQCKRGHVRGRADRVHVSFAETLARARASCLPILDEFREHARRRLREKLQAARDAEKDSAARLDRIRQRRSRLLDAFVSGALDRDEFERRDIVLREDLSAATRDARGAADMGVDLETAVGTCVGVLSDIVTLWERVGVDGRQRLAKVFFADGLMMLRGGAVQTSPGAGMAGALSASVGDGDRMARLGVLGSNLIGWAWELQAVA